MEIIKSNSKLALVYNSQTNKYHIGWANNPEHKIRGNSYYTKHIAEQQFYAMSIRMGVI